MTRGFLSALIMRPHICHTVLHVSMWVLLFTLNADGVNPECETFIKVRRDTVYEAVAGQELRIRCTVQFCNNTLPVSWTIFANDMYVRVNNSSRIKTEWEQLNGSEGTSYLIFSKTLSSDSGVYNCRSGNVVSHKINVSVHVDHGAIDDEATTVTTEIKPNTEPTKEAGNQTDEDSLWVFVYRAGAIAGFFIIVIVMCILINKRGKSRPPPPPPDQSLQLSHHATEINHIYDND